MLYICGTYICLHTHIHCIYMYVHIDTYVYAYVYVHTLYMYARGIKIPRWILRITLLHDKEHMQQCVHFYFAAIVTLWLCFRYSRKQRELGDIEKFQCYIRFTCMCDITCTCLYASCMHLCVWLKVSKTPIKFSNNFLALLTF